MDEQLSATILKHLVHEPTEGQKILTDTLSSFILNHQTDSLFIVKGYAGTGKTTLISALINSLGTRQFTMKTVLLAPTGRAAKVLGNYSGLHAYTIHKKIYKIHTSADGSNHLILQKNLHKNTVFIIDEASMIPDSRSNTDSLFASRNLLDDLIEYIFESKSCKCIFVGDTAQLPPVSSSENFNYPKVRDFSRSTQSTDQSIQSTPLSPALDINILQQRYSLNIITYELTEVVRQATESGILANATSIRKKIAENNIALPLFNLNPKPNPYSDIKSTTGAELEDALQDAYGKYGIDNCIIICRSNKLANNFNFEIRKRILCRETEIQSGDNMMVVKNNYFWLSPESEAGFIANGDLIQIRKVKKITEMYGFKFADLTVSLLDYPDEKDLDVKIIMNTITAETPSLPYSDDRKLFNEIMQDYNDKTDKKNTYKEVKANPFMNALQVKFAYSLTCHKTQGGQWDVVFINKGYLTKDMMNLEYLRWLYTALTRAKIKVYLINFTDDFFE